MRPACWIAAHLANVGECHGNLVMAHLIPKQVISRELGRLYEGAQLKRIVWDPRVWVPLCGGQTGVGGHHGALDFGGVNRLRIPRAMLPPELEEFAIEHGLVWRLDHDYGLKE